MKTLQLITPENQIRVLKVGTCPSLSGKSNLTYHVGCNARSEIQLRIHANTGGGFFNDDWVSLDAIRQQLEKGKPEEPITSFALHPIFRGRSANTPSFLFAVLLKEGFVQASRSKKRCYERLEPKAFMAEVKGLIASKVALVIDPPIVIAKPKPADAKPLQSEAKASPVAAKASPVAKPKPATPAKPVIKGKQYTAGKKTVAKGKKK